MVISHIASDNVAGGRMAGEFIATQLQGHGKVLELEGIPGTSAAHGFNEVISTYSGIEISAREIADFNREKAREMTTQLLDKGFVFDAVFAHNDEMILGAIEAFEASQQQKPSILVGFDAIPEALEAIKQQRLTATIAQKPEDMGWQAVQTAVSALQGETLSPVIFVDLKLIK